MLRRYSGPHRLNTASTSLGAVPVPDLLKRLLTASGPSGHETDPARAWREACSRFAPEVGADHLGSSFARVPGTGDGPRLAIVGHIDEIGVHVSHIDDDGYLRFGEVGGWDAIVLVGQRVRLQTRNGAVTGVIGRKPIHLLKDDDRKKVPELKELHIDIGAKDGDEARELVRIGDVAVIDAGPLELLNGRVVARALDNRVGCFVAAEAARLVAEGGTPRSPYVPPGSRSPRLRAATSRALGSRSRRCMWFRRTRPRSFRS